MKYNESEVREAKSMIEMYTREHRTLYTVIRSVSRSGMSRRIDVYAIRENKPCYLSAYVAKMLGYSHPDRKGIRVDGCGMDMAWNLVYELNAVMELTGDDRYRHERL